MFGRKRNVIRSSQNPQIAYRQGAILTNGALEFVYLKPVAWPIFTMWGPGILNRNQVNVLQGPQLRNDLALTVAPIVGAGVPAGYIGFDGLEGGDTIEP